MEYDRLLCAVALSRIFAYRSAEGRKLIELAGGPEELFRMSREKLETIIRSSEVIKKVLDPDTRRWAEEEIEWCLRYGIKVIYFEDSEYPARLAECYDSPVVIYAMGTADLNPKRALAVVGTRRATYYGKTQCARITQELATLDIPPVIVSGLAYGIDGAAHLAALENGLETIAVIPSGLDSIYPPQHRELAARIARQGTLVTDFPRCSFPQVAHFVRRNRIIAGISDATLLVESFARGGGLITTSLANSYDREVFALPGRIGDAASEGCNRLIGQNLAHLVTDAYGIASLMGWTGPKKGTGSNGRIELEPGEDGDSGKVLAILREESPRDFEEIMQLSGLEFKALTQVLLTLEIEGRIVSVEGRKYGIAP